MAIGVSGNTYRGRRSHNDGHGARTLNMRAMVVTDSVFQSPMAPLKDAAS